MSVPAQTTVAPQQTQPIDMQIIPAHQAAPPAYEDEKSQAITSDTVPGQPRTDDPASAEMIYDNNQPPAMVTPLTSLFYEPAWIDCPHCHKRSMTDVRREASDRTWIYTLLCCLCCGCIGAIFPLVFNWGADFDHYCKSCNQQVARIPAPN